MKKVTACQCRAVGVPNAAAAPLLVDGSEADMLAVGGLGLRLTTDCCTKPVMASKKLHKHRCIFVYSKLQTAIIV